MAAPHNHPEHDFEQEHLSVLLQAMGLYKKASMVRGQMWLEFPPSDKIRELRERVTRIEYAYAQRDAVLPPVQGSDFPQAAAENAIIEDALDVINYANFLIKQIRRGQSG